MKPRNREINIFNMSALDLFASALGAFILLAVISLPYFGNIKVISSKAKIPAIDIVICLDISGSMTNSVESLKNEIVDLSKVLNKMAESVAMGVVVFGDNGYDRPTTKYTLKKLAKKSDFKELVAFVQTLKTRMGTGSGSNSNDGEALYKGLHEAINMPWRSNSRKKFIIVYTDDVAHAHELKRLFAEVKRFSSNSNHFISTTLVSENPLAAAQLLKIAKAGKGEFIDASKGRSFWASFMLAIIK